MTSNARSLRLLSGLSLLALVACEAGIASGATLVLASAGYLDSATYEEGFPHVNDMPLGVFSSEERPGTYSATVRRAGHATWDTVGVVVTADQCHVRPKVLTARLQPLP